MILLLEAHLAVVHINPKFAFLCWKYEMGLSILIKINQEPLLKRFSAVGHPVTLKLQFGKKNVIKFLAVSYMGVCEGKVFKAMELHTASIGLEALLCVPRGETAKPILLLPC